MDENCTYCKQLLKAVERAAHIHHQDEAHHRVECPDEICTHPVPGSSR